MKKPYLESMEKRLIEFIDTLDCLFKRVQEDVGSSSGMSKLTISQLQYIEAIHELGEPTITEVAQRLKFTKASVTAGINKLIEKGYVVKVQSHEDKRFFYTKLTKTGQKFIDAKYLALKEYGDFIRAALSEDEARQFEAIVTKLVERFRQV
ncbi:MAG: MarR family transcriptional regulator [Cyanobacteriota bacterium]|nr:MarR family transcriptional regulator [Cyanobacteriota bacterium]